DTHARVSQKRRREDRTRAAVLDLTGCPEELFRLLHGVGFHTTGEHFTRCGGYGVMGAGETGDGVEKDDDIVTAFYKTFRLLQRDRRDLHVFFRRFVKGRGDDLGLYTAFHIGDFLGTFVDE